jgi:hypothetical protein
MNVFVSIFSHLPIVLICGMKLDWSGFVIYSPVGAANDVTLKNH